MKLISPILTLATMASGTSAAINKDRARTKKQTIFHKVDDLQQQNESNATSAAKQAESLLGNVHAARQGRGKRGERGKKGRKSRRSWKDEASAMEKKTNVKREDVVQKSLDRRSITKKREEQKRKQNEPVVVDDAASEKEATTLDGEANASDLLSEERIVKKNKTTKVANTNTKTAKVEAAASGLRTGDANENFEFEEWADTTAEAEVSSATPAPAAIPDTENIQELMQKRRQDRAADFVQRKARARTATAPAPSSKRGAQEPENTTKQRQRRTSKTPVERAPNPRPGAQRKGPKPEGKRRPGYDKRDLKKSKKSSWSSSSGSGSWSSEYDCEVRMTNLSKEQWFSDIFWMVHSDKVELPLWEYGEPAFDDLARLAQDGDADELIDFYEFNDDGVLEVDSVRGPLENGDSLFFGVPQSGSYDLLTLATSFIFSNDGFVSIEGLDNGDMNDGAIWYLWGLDAGVEANTQLCWTVQASSQDFPPNSACFDIDEDIADENDNRFPGEGYVYVHSGIHDLEDKRDLQDFLSFTCDDLEADSFAEYFFELGFDDDELLYDDDRGRNEKDDQSFLDFVEDNDDEFGNRIIFQLAVDAGSFDDFCDELEDIEDFLFNAFETLEPQIFDFRTPMMRVELDC